MGAKKHTAIRLDPATTARIDALIPCLSTPWHKATRSDAVRAVIAAGLDVLGKPAKPARGRKGGRR
jgi:hypothetical protein